MKIRIISAAVALAIVIPLFIIGGIPYSLGVMVVAMLALKEYLDMKETKKELPMLIKLLAYLSIPLILLTITVEGASLMTIDFRILSGIFLVLLLPMVVFHERKIYSINDACYVTAGVLFIGFSMSYLITYYNLNRLLLIYLFLITSITDTYALFVGNKLLEVVSPKKTWEGFIGGSLVGTFISVMFYKTFVNPNVVLSNLIVITLFLTIIGQLGDLFFSAIKRYYDKKDFSNIMPGHGGILDRLDSFIFVMLAFIYYVIIGGNHDINLFYLNFRCCSISS